MIPVVIWGASGHALVLAEFVAESGYRIVSFFDNDKAVLSPLSDIPIFYGPKEFTDWLGAHREDELAGIAAIGGPRGKERRSVLEAFKVHGLVTPAMIHPTAFVASDVRIGEGSHILANAAVCAAAQIGKAVIVNTGASVDHECKIHAGAHIAPGARLAGCVNVGENAMVGIGAIILPRLTIGAGAIVGAGAVVTKSVRENQIVYGNPAKEKNN